MALLCTANARPEVGREECGICYEAYKRFSGGHLPKLLWCCHSLCLDCLRKLVCPHSAFPFIVCPFCRTVTVVPKEGLQALKTDEALLQEVTPQGGGGPPEPREEAESNQDPPSTSNRSLSDSALDLNFNYQAGSPVFSISSIVPATYPVSLNTTVDFCTWLHMQDMRNTLVLEIPPRTSARDFETPSSVETLRLVFAVAIILLIISVFFALVFLK